MSRYYAIRVIDGRHVVGVTTDGLDWLPLPKTAFGRPRDAIRYAEMRQQDVQPLRSGEEGDAHPSFTPGPRLSPAADTAGRVMDLGDLRASGQPHPVQGTGT